MVSIFISDAATFNNVQINPMDQSVRFSVANQNVMLLTESSPPNRDTERLCQFGEYDL